MSVADGEPLGRVALLSAGGWVRGLLAGLLVAVATLLLYSRVLRPDFDFVSLDDSTVVLDNAAVRQPSWAAVQRLFRDPRQWWSNADTVPRLTTVSFMLDSWLAMRAGSSAAFVFHRTSLLLHVLNVVLLFWVMRRLGAGALGAAGLAALFAFHPLQVEAVAWVARRETLLGAFFSLLSIGAYLERRDGRVSGRVWFGVSMLSGLLALLASPKVIALPFVLMLLDVWPLRRWSRPALFEKLPLMGLCAAGPLHVLLNGPRVPMGGIWMARNFSSLLDRVVWPLRLSPFYPAGSSALTALAWSLVSVAAFVGVLVWAWRTWRALGVGLAAFGLMLLPALWPSAASPGMVRDHAVYLPLVFLLFPLAAWMGTDRPRRVMGVAVVAGVLAVAAIPQVLIWRDGESLFRYTLTLYPDSGAPRAALGDWLTAHGRATEALPLLEKAVELEPEVADYHLHLGHALRVQDHWTEARGEYERAVTLQPGNPRYQQALGACFAMLGRWRDALTHYEAAREAAPESPEIRMGLGFSLLQVDRPAAARAEFQEALMQRPRDPQIHLGLACAWARMDLLEQCRAHLSKAVSLDATFAERAGREPALRGLAGRPGFEKLIKLPGGSSRQTAKPH